MGSVGSLANGVVGHLNVVFKALPRRIYRSMDTIRSVWASVQGDPVFMRRVNGWLTIFWVAMLPISYELGWLNSVTFVSALSLWALVSGHWSAWQAARVEVYQQQEDIAGDVVKAVVEKTDVQPA